jgi:hypothetical protein
MNTLMNQIVIHVDENVDASLLDEIEREIRIDAGAVSLTRRLGRPHLIVTDYDAAKHRGSELLASFRRHGLHAQLIAL